VPVLAFDPALVLELAATEGANVMGAVPTMLIAMMEHAAFDAAALSALRAVLSGGSTVPAELVPRVAARLRRRFGIACREAGGPPATRGRWTSVAIAASRGASRT